MQNRFVSPNSVIVVSNLSFTQYEKGVATYCHQHGSQWARTSSVSAMRQDTLPARASMAYHTISDAIRINQPVPTYRFHSASERVITEIG